MTYKNNRTANHGDSILTPSGTVGTLQVLNLSLAGTATTKILTARNGIITDDPVEVGECYHGQDAYNAADQVATLQTLNTELTGKVATAEVEIVRLNNAIKDLTPK